MDSNSNDSYSACTRSEEDEESSSNEGKAISARKKPRKVNDRDENPETESGGGSIPFHHSERQPLNNVI